MTLCYLEESWLTRTTKRFKHGGVLQVFRIGHDDNLACFLGVHRIYPIPLLPLVEIDR
jgi:hypothetical protein